MFARFFYFVGYMAGMADTVTEKVKTLAEPVLEDLGLELFDVQYRREQSGWVLRLVIDRPEGVTLDDCVAASREIGQILDIEDFIEQKYNLEVSSPGLDRPLRTLDDFQRFAGRRAKIKTSEPVDGERVFTGKIRRVEEDMIILEADRREVAVPSALVAKARLEVEF